MVESSLSLTVWLLGCDLRVVVIGDFQSLPSYGIR